MHRFWLRLSLTGRRRRRLRAEAFEEGVDDRVRHPIEPGGVGLRLLTHEVMELRKEGRVLEQSAVLEHQALDRGLRL